MRQIVHIVGLALFCAIAISNAGTASETGGGRYLADVKSGKLILERGRSSPSGETAYRPESVVGGGAAGCQACRREHDKD